MKTWTLLLAVSATQTLGFFKVVIFVAFSSKTREKSSRLFVKYLDIGVGGIRNDNMTFAVKGEVFNVLELTGVHSFRTKNEGLFEFQILTICQGPCAEYKNKQDE